MLPKLIFTTFAVLSVTSLIARAGDAVAIGYNDKGLWTSVIYYCSGTPKGGADYKDAKGAREAALQDLKKRGGAQMATSKIVASSDKTGSFAVVSGQASTTENANDVFVVGYGQSKKAAEKDAFDQLMRQKATKKIKVHYNYFSHGEDGK